MHTLEQDFAEKVYQQITQVEQQSRTFKDEYGGMAHKLPVLIRQAGLVQALAYVAARGKKGAKQLLEDLANVLEYSSTQELLQNSREAPLLEYMRLTRQATVALTWYKRFAQSVLGVDPTTEEDRE